MRLENKTILTIFNEVFERFSRFSSLYEQLSLQGDPSLKKFLLLQEGRLALLEKRIPESIVTRAYENKDLDAKEVEEFLHHLRPIIEGFLKLHANLKYLYPYKAHEEIHLLIHEVCQEAYHLPDNHSRMVLLSEQYSHTLNPQDVYESNEIAICYLPILSNNSPLYWNPVVKSLARYIDTNFEVTSALIQEFTYHHKVQGKMLQHIREFIQDMVSGIIAVKLLGPAYYNAISTDLLFLYPTLVSEQGYAYCPQTFTYCPTIRNNVLWQTLSMGNLENSVSETYNTIINFLRQTTHQQEDSLETYTDQLVPEINRRVNEIIKQSFNQNHLFVSKKISQKLGENLLISSRTNIQTEYLYNELSQLEADDHLNTEKIYTSLNKLQDVPNLPSEIINAGWIYKEGHLEKNLEILLSRSDGQKYKLMNQYTRHLDSLLIKSIETSQVHQVLLTQI